MTLQSTTSGRTSGASHSRGFALVVTLSLMILLTVVAVGLLSLSSITLRTAGQGEAAATARGNARLALMLALGEIQKELGPDQKITAVSGILASSGSTGSGGTAAAATGLKHPQLAGVWNSRQEVLSNNAPNYDRDSPFVRWLVSSANPDDLKKTNFAESGDFGESVILASARGTGAGAVPTLAGKVPVTTSKTGIQGNFAWWVGDENCKGFTNPVDTQLGEGSTTTVPDLLAGTATPGAYGMRALDKNYPANTPDAAKVLTHAQLALASSAGTAAKDWFHDLSPYSSGLLTNVVKGGWRQDLNLFLEPTTKPADPWPKSGFPAQTGPNKKYALSEVNDYDVLPWKYLYDYYHQKERVAQSGGRPYLQAWRGLKDSTPDDKTNPGWNSGVLRPGPVLVRSLTFISFGTVQIPGNTTDYFLRFYAYPVITLWNPYNVDLKMGAQEICYLLTAFPMEHKISINGTYKETFSWRKFVSTDVGNRGAGVMPVLNRPLTLKAGECKMLSPVSWTWASNHCNHQVEDGAFKYGPKFAGGEWGVGTADLPAIASKGTATDRIKLETVVSLWENGGGAYIKDYPATFDIRTQHSGTDDGNWPPFCWGGKIGWLYEGGLPSNASPDALTKKNLPTATFGELLNAPKPFMVVDAQLKALDEAQVPNKVWRDCIPAHDFQGVTKGLNNVTPYYANPYKLKFDSIDSFQQASLYLQVAPDDPSHSYFGASYDVGAGQTWITEREIPMAPFTSLAQLQHLAQTSCDNMYSSGFHFQNRAIGNSFASPGVPSNQVKTNGWDFCLDMWTNEQGGTIDGKKYPRAQFHPRPNIDRSYAANNLLWDDYFFSSMAAKNDVLRSGSSGASKIALATVVKDFFENGKPLPNERYRAYLGKPTSDIIKRLMAGSQPTTNGYKEAASYLTVDGAFNVNSVSVKAWKTLFASLHGKKLAALLANGKPAVSNGGDYIVSRFSMPNAVAGGSSASSSSAEWQGYHELNEAQIDELAEAMVRQVKQRGPFRSLAEFINRRLGPETDERTKYGALQGALEDPSVSINAKWRSSQITAADIPGTNYQNKTAALGPRYQGSPPYVTQADILNSIGPVLSARSDTFLIRGYGEARDAKGNILARAWCEAAIQRVPDFVDSQDPAETALASLQSPVNRIFGRRFNMISFRWLSGSEI